MVSVVMIVLSIFPQWICLGHLSRLIRLAKGHKRSIVAKAYVVGQRNTCIELGLANSLLDSVFRSIWVYKDIHVRFNGVFLAS